MDSYVNSLLNAIKKAYVIDSSQLSAIKAEVRSLLQQFSAGKIARDQGLERLKLILASLQYKPFEHKPETQERTNERIGTVTKIVASFGITPKRILDIGAGTGRIITDLRKHYDISEANVYAIDQKLPKIDEITPLVYNSDGTIPLRSDSIDLIITFMTLHHIPPTPRSIILSEISRVLSSNGIVIIREHDDDGEANFLSFLDLLHIFWYLAAGETEDPLYLMSRMETQRLFSQVEMEPVYYDTYQVSNPQRIYHEVYMKRPKKGALLSTYIGREVDAVPEFPYVHTFITEEESRAVRKGMTKDQIGEWKFSDYFTDIPKAMMPQTQGKRSEYCEWKSTPSLFDLSPLQARKTLHSSPASGMPDALQPNIAVLIMQKYKPGTVLDPDIGLGEILLAAVLAKDFVSREVTYVGVSNSPQMEFWYQAIIDHYGVWRRCRVVDSISQAPRIVPMVFCSLSSATVQTGDRIGRLMQAWARVKTGGVMCVYVGDDIGRDDGEMSIYRAISSLPDVHSHTMELDCVHVWTKAMDYLEKPAFPEITFMKAGLSGGVYKLGGYSSATRALHLYIRSLPGSIIYICEEYDKVAVDLARACGKMKDITVYVKLGARDAELSKELTATNETCTIIPYSLSYVVQRKAVIAECGDLTGDDQVWRDILQDKWLDNAGFVAVMTWVLRQELSDLPEPKRLHIATLRSPVLLRCLLEIWPSCVFILGAAVDISWLPFKYLPRVISGGDTVNADRYIDI